MPFTKYSADLLSIDRESRLILIRIHNICNNRFYCRPSMCYLQQMQLLWFSFKLKTLCLQCVEWSFHHWIGTCVRLSVFDDWLIWRCFDHFDSRTNTNLHKRSTFVSLKKWNSVLISAEGTCAVCTSRFKFFFSVQFLNREKHR